MKRTLIVLAVAVVLGVALVDAVEATVAVANKIQHMAELARTGAIEGGVSLPGAAQVGADSTARATPASLAFLQGA